MSAQRDELRCGSCGADYVTVAHVAPPRDTRAGGGPFSGHLEFTCVGCGSVTELRLEAPKFVLQWGEGAEGIVCGGWPEKSPPGR